MVGLNLLNRLAEFRDRTFMIWRGQACSYTELLERIEAWKNMLASAGVRPGECVAFCGDFSFGAASLLLALAANGNIAIPLTREVLSAREQQQRSRFASWLIEFDAEDAWQLRPLGAEPSHPLLQELRAAGEAGIVLFSSGSTGEPKASLLSVPRLLTRFTKPGRAFRMLSFLLLDHMGGVNTLLSIVCNGGTAVTVEQRTVESVCEAIAAHRVQLLPATPTFLNMLLLAEASRRYDLSSLEFISYGTEPMPASTLKALSVTFPHVKLRQLYGLTELGILPTKTEVGDGLKIQVGGDDCEVRIVNGILWVRARTAMLGYLNAPSPFDAEGWFNTGDAVMEENGYLRVLGRESEMINVGGEKVFPAAVEEVILEVENVRDVVVRGRPNAVTGQIVVARVLLQHPEPARDVERRVRNHCRQVLAQFKVPAIVEIADDTLHNERFKRVRRVTQPERESVRTL
jgi:acyl-CoA synthetase (AMP-forming)/AMP-acid ligase II